MIYCVEDDAAIRELMVYTLNNSGFEAIGFEDGRSFKTAIKDTLPELIMLDIMLPDVDGIQLLKELKSNNSYRDIPVIMATAKGTEFDKVKGLDLGADDYLAKPFGMMEMLSRIKAVLRRVYKDESHVYIFEDIKLDDTSHEVSVNNKLIELTLKEYELLKLLLSNPRRVITRDELMSVVWDSEIYGETRTVDVHVASLRTKLGNSGSYIKTIRGVGYRLKEES